MSLNLQWAAGFFDGEGSVGIYASKSSRRFSLRCSINQARSSVVDDLFAELQLRYGGHLQYPKRYSEKHRQAVAWGLYGDAAVRFLQDIAPYTVIKTPQILAVVSWQMKFGNYRAPGQADEKFTEANRIMDMLAVHKGPKRKNRGKG